MKFKVVKVEDTEEMRDIHKLAFGGDPWPGDDHEFWVVYDEHGAVAAFASAILVSATCVFLSRAAVVLRYQGRGLQKKLITTRLKWAKKEGADTAVTHVKSYNYASMVALIKSGFRFAYRSQCPKGYSDFHFLWAGACTEPELIRWLLATLA